MYVHEQYVYEDTTARWPYTSVLANYIYMYIHVKIFKHFFKLLGLLCKKLNVVSFFLFCFFLLCTIVFSISLKVVVLGR